jgi:hypothetical protein
MMRRGGHEEKVNAGRSKCVMRGGGEEEEVNRQGEGHNERRRSGRGRQS